MKCPRQCESELRVVTLSDLGGAQVHLCPDCEGAWYPHGALSAVGQSSSQILEGTDLSVSLVGDKLEQIDLEADVECPVCNEKMSRFSYSLAPQVKIDECFDHGTWLDDGELGTIVEAVASTTANMAKYRKDISDMREEMDIDGIARGGSALNPVAATMRILNWMFVKKTGA